MSANSDLKRYLIEQWIIAKLCHTVQNVDYRPYKIATGWVTFSSGY